MLNSQSARFKSSKVERKMNKLVMYNVGAQVILCSIVAIIGSFWYQEYEDDKLYLPFDYHFAVNGVISFFSYFLLMSTLLPISLIVTLEIVKVVQAYFIINDVKIFA